MPEGGLAVNKMCLTVAIPTYNRPESVLRRLDELEQLRDLVDEVVIGDNSDSVQPAVEARAARAANVRYFRNTANIGGGANFLRVVEASSGDFVWWRGDDDPITPAQAQAVRNALANASPKLILLSPTARTVFRAAGVKRFCEHFSDVRSMGWLSSIILPGALAKQALRFGYVGIASGWANVALVLGLFRTDPELEFEVQPFTMVAGDFRELGREALRWTFFTTCIRNFPETSNILATPELRKVYLDRWRSTQTLRLVKTMTRLRLGYMTQEPITWRTLRPLVDVASPRSSLLALTLWLMARTPRIVYQVFFAAVWNRLSPQKRSELEIPQLQSCKSYLGTLKALRRSNSSPVGETFI